MPSTNVGINNVVANYDLRTALINAGWDQIKPVSVYIKPSQFVIATSPSQVAISILGTFPGGIHIWNYGYIVGGGGLGGSGAVSLTGASASQGTNGGYAMMVYNFPIFANEFKLYNAGVIGGGGGGGGGGYAGDWGYGGSGGGGGAGGGSGVLGRDPDQYGAGGGIYWNYFSDGTSNPTNYGTGGNGGHDGYTGGQAIHTDSGKSGGIVTGGYGGPSGWLGGYGDDRYGSAGGNGGNLGANGSPGYGRPGGGAGGLGGRVFSSPISNYEYIGLIGGSIYGTVF